MVQIPANTVTPEDIAAWHDLQEQLASIKAKEAVMRDKIYKGLFSAPAEGTNSVEIGNGWKLNAVRVVSRKIDLPVLQAMATPVGALQSVNLRADDLVTWKPELNMKAYRQLTAEQLAIFDQCLEIKDGSPQVKLVAPKE